MKIIIPTHWKYHSIIDINIKILDVLWPKHPPILCISDICPVPNISTIYAAKPNISWAQMMKHGLSKYHDEFLLLWLDDYLLRTTPNEDMIQHTIETMTNNPQIGYINFSQGLPKDDYIIYHDRYIKHPKWKWSINLQAAIWRTSSLKHILNMVHDTNPWQFEIEGSKLQNDGKFNMYNLTHTIQSVHLYYYNLLNNGKINETAYDYAVNYL